MAAAAAAGVVAVTITVNEPMNHRVTAEQLSDADTADLLQSWHGGVASVQRSVFSRLSGRQWL